MKGRRAEGFLVDIGGRGFFTMRMGGGEGEVWR